MAIKNALNQIIPLSLRAKDNIQKSIKSDSTTDRDANGQQAYGDNQKQKEPMSEEQLKKALEHLKNLPAVVENNLIVELIMQDQKNFIILKDPTGKIIRRIPEFELWSLQVIQDDKKGQILNRTA